MAKKVVATLKTGTGKQFTKCIKMVKSEKTGAYMFKEGIVPNDQVKRFLRGEEASILRVPGLLNTKGIRAWMPFVFFRRMLNPAAIFLLILSGNCDRDEEKSGFCHHPLRRGGERRRGGALPHAGRTARPLLRRRGADDDRAGVRLARGGLSRGREHGPRRDGAAVPSGTRRRRPAQADRENGAGRPAASAATWTGRTCSERSRSAPEWRLGAGRSAVTSESQREHTPFDAALHRSRNRLRLPGQTVLGCVASGKDHPSAGPSRPAALLGHQRPHVHPRPAYRLQHGGRTEDRPPDFRNLAGPEQPARLRHRRLARSGVGG